jgi:hypothetical protein
MLTYLRILIACVLGSILVYKMNTVKGLSSSKQNIKYVWSKILMECNRFTI